MTGVLSGLLLTGCLCAEEGKFHFFRNGQMECVLVQKKGAPPPVTKAVREFTALVKRATGKNMSVCTRPVPGKKFILLQWEERKPHDTDRFSIRFPEKDCMLITGSGESISYALEYILENAFRVRRLVIHYADFRWRNRPKRIDRSLEISCEKVTEASLARRDISQTASFNYKRALWTHLSGWKTRDSFPGIHNMIMWAFPFSKYGPDNSWPEEILPIVKGKRIKMPDGRLKGSISRCKVNWQPCWSNPATTRIAVENILEQLEIAKKKNRKVYSVNLDVNDQGGYCSCRDCLAAVGKKKNSVRRQCYSNLYWKWVNNIAEQVTKKYPDTYFNCLAYREVIEPPDFQLHPNVIPQICRELTACLDPAARKDIEGLFARWSKKANVLFLWDYQRGMNSYMLPRIYCHYQAELYKMVYRYNVRGIFMECFDVVGFEGPKHYVNGKLLWDIHTDVDQAIREWCEAAAGKESAPYLAEYYKFWEEYWLRPGIRKTSWFNSARASYLQMGEEGTYTYALRKGEMKKLRRLLEKALEKARTPDQKRRMEIYLHDVFAMIEALVKCLFSEYMQYDGTLASASDALSLLQSVPEALEALACLKKNAVIPDHMREKVEGGFISNINSVMPFLKDPAVKAQLEKLSARKDLPEVLRAQLQILNGKQYKNLYPEGSFEPGTKIPRGLTVDTEHVSHGKRSVRFREGGYEFIVNGIKPGKTYYLALDVYSGNNSLEGKFNFLVGPRVKKQAQDWKRLENRKLGKGWQTISVAYRTPSTVKIDNFRLVVQAHFFEQDEMLWLDNIRVYPLD